MNDERTLLVGLDLGNDFSQLSCFDQTLFEPVPIGEEPGQEVQELIPTVAAVRDDNHEWVFGKKALQYAQTGKAALLHDIVISASKGVPLLARETAFEGRTVLERFFRFTLSKLKMHYPNDTILKLVVTVEEKNKPLTNAITDAMKVLGIEDDRLMIQSHKQSYMYYALSQNKELWNNDVALFDYGPKGLKYHQISIDRYAVPMVAGVTEKNLSDVMSADFLETAEDAQIAHGFLEVAKTAMHRQLVSTIYVTGPGFDTGEWAETALRELCVGRRVFKGQNLYTKGACYAARELSGKGKLDCIFLDDDMVQSNISIRVYTQAQTEEVLLVKAGQPWYDIDTSLDVIPDAEDELQLIIQDLLRKEKRTHLLSLVAIPGRENKMTRFSIRIRFSSPHECIITLKDKGFGDFEPTSNRIWERMFEM